MLVEWPEKGGAAVPLPDLDLQLVYRGEARGATLHARSETGEDWIAKLAIDRSLSFYLSNLT
jgi:tRNA threonylcarbamoyladenosine biosynthesis protein TsaE